MTTEPETTFKAPPQLVALEAQLDETQRALSRALKQLACPPLKPGAEADVLDEVRVLLERRRGLLLALGLAVAHQRGWLP